MQHSLRRELRSPRDWPMITAALCVLWIMYLQHLEVVGPTVLPRGCLFVDILRQYCARGVATGWLRSACGRTSKAIRLQASWLCVFGAPFVVHWWVTRSAPWISGAPEHVSGSLQRKRHALPNLVPSLPAFFASASSCGGVGIVRFFATTTSSSPLFGLRSCRSPRSLGFIWSCKLCR